MYICGKISADTRDQEIKNIYGFFRKAEELKKLNIKAYNPAHHEIPGGDWAYYLSRDLKWMYEHRKKIMMYVLPNHEGSRGLELELAFAKELGIPIYYEPTPETQYTLTEKGISETNKLPKM